MGTPESRFHQACDELGWGDAIHGLWFVAIEEAQEWQPHSEATIERLYNHHEYFRDATVEGRTRPPDPPPEEGRSRSTYVESNIAAPLSRSIPDPSRFRDLLLRLGGNVAHANLYPLARPHTNQPFPKHYTDLFGFGPGPAERKRYEEAVAGRRFPRLREAVEKLHPQAIVCMGKDWWSEFRGAFAATSEARTIVAGKLLAYDRQKIILTTHFAFGHLSEALQQHITDTLRAWSVELP